MVQFNCFFCCCCNYFTGILLLKRFSLIHAVSFFYCEFLPTFIQPCFYMKEASIFVYRFFLLCLLLKQCVRFVHFILIKVGIVVMIIVHAFYRLSSCTLRFFFLHQEMEKPAVAQLLREVSHLSLDFQRLNPCTLLACQLVMEPEQKGMMQVRLLVYTFFYYILCVVMYKNDMKLFKSKHICKFQIFCMVSRSNVRERDVWREYYEQFCIQGQYMIFPLLPSNVLP